MLFRVVHDHDDPLVVVVPLARPATAETLDLVASPFDVVDLDVEVDADLGVLRLWHSLEGQPRLVIKARANGGPSGIVAMFAGDRPAQQRAPEGCQPRGILAVDRDPGQAICHAYTLAPICRSSQHHTVSILEVTAVPDRPDPRPGEWARFFRSANLPGAEVLHASFVSHRYAAHLHDSWTVAAVEEGAAAFALASRRYVASAGSAFLIPPGMVHTGEPAAQDGYVYRVLYLEPEQVAVDDGPPVIARPPSSRSVGPVVVRDGTLLSRLVWLHQLVPVPGHALEQGEALASATTAVARIVSPDSSAGQRDQRPVGRVVDFIQAHWQEDFSLGALAQATGFSRYHLVRTFHREMGVPPSAYRRALRVAAAQRLLRNGERPADVATACGFYDQPHLNRHFKQAVGVTPARYARARP
jgi:AraC-like DNA-binding protein